MSHRELIALGTSSQTPTRERSHNAYMLLWDAEGFLFDPGEGTQRQLILADIAARRIHHICITHLHGDHCLGLAGILQRLSLDQCEHPVHIYYPQSGQIFIDRLCRAALFQNQIELIFHPIDAQLGTMLEVHGSPGYSLKALSLDHSVPTMGFRLEEAAGIRFIAEKLDLMGIHGPMVGELQRKGRLEVAGKIVRIEEVTAVRPGNVFAFIMDTRPCPEAIELAKDADLVVMEATYTSEHQDQADVYFHSTAAAAAKIALEAGAHRLALAHFSQRYIDTDQHLLEAKQIFPNVIALNDLDRIEIPRRAQTIVE